MRYSYLPTFIYNNITKTMVFTFIIDSYDIRVVLETKKTQLMLLLLRRFVNDKQIHITIKSISH